MSCPSNLISCATIPTLSNSDDLGLHLLLSAGSTPKRPKRKGRYVWKYGEANFDLAREILENTNWVEILTDDINTSWANWRNRFLEVMESCIPKVLIKPKRNLPWLTNSVVMAINKRAAKKSRSSAALLKYRAARNRATALLRLNKNKFFKRLGNSSIGKPSNHSAIKTPVCPHSNMKAGMLNPIQIKPIESNPDKVHQCFNRSLPPLPSHSSWLDPTNFPENLLCTEDAVLDLVTNLDASKATGPDDISARMLKETAPSIVFSLTKLLNLSLTSGKLPSAWKLARV